MRPYLVLAVALAAAAIAGCSTSNKQAALRPGAPTDRTAGRQPGVAEAEASFLEDVEQEAQTSGRVASSQEMPSEPEYSSASRRETERVLRQFFVLCEKGKTEEADAMVFWFTKNWFAIGNMRLPDEIHKHIAGRRWHIAYQDTYLDDDLNCTCSCFKLTIDGEDLPDDWTVVKEDGRPKVIYF